jgi:hypothetical protein
MYNLAGCSSSSKTLSPRIEVVCRLIYEEKETIYLSELRRDFFG